MKTGYKRFCKDLKENEKKLKSIPSITKLQIQSGSIKDYFFELTLFELTSLYRWDNLKGSESVCLSYNTVA